MLQHHLWLRNTKAFDAMITTSSAMKERLEAEGLGPFRIVPNGCNDRPPRPPLSDPPEVAYAGRLSAEKGVDTLLRAFQGVLGRLPEARLRIFGDGPLKSQLQELANGLGIVDRVEFLGQLPTAEMERRLDSAWLQAVPSRWQEPFGMVAIEAMMRGTVVVASDGGGLRDIVRDHRTGLLIPTGDVEAWAAGLIRLLDDRAECEKMGAIGRQVALEEYSADRQVERMLSIYEELMKKEPGS
jgi:glycosyltransferase involved in cell wall biosynthesis